MPKNFLKKIHDMENPLRFYWISMLAIGISGIIISTISLKSSVKIFRVLEKGNSYQGNEPYRAAIIVTVIIGIIILVWGFKNLVSSFFNMIRRSQPAPLEFENYDEIENTVVKQQISSRDKLLETVIKKNKFFIKGFVCFLTVVSTALLAKMVMPVEFFWDLRIDSTYFSFPLIFIMFLATAAGLRLASIYLYRHLDNREIGISEIIKSIKSENNPYNFVPQIEKALLSTQRFEKPPFISRFGFTESEKLNRNTGEIHKKLLIETYPQHVPYARHPIIYLFLTVAVILFISGFFFLAKLPPDNISVLTVPTIAIDYIWTIIKGIVFLLTGRGLLKIAYRIFTGFHFESVLAFVEIKGNYEKEKVNVEKIGSDAAQSDDSGDAIFRSDCHFKIYTTKLLTEMIASKRQRYIINMFVENEAEKTKKTVVEVIETFGQKGLIKLIK